MRTMMKKCGVVVALAAVLLTAAALIVGCPAVGPQSEPQHQSPEGMGAIKLNFNKAIQRATILPDDVDLTYFEDGGFLLQFQPVDGSGDPDGATIDEIILYADRNAPIDLPEGDYTLTVIAYVDWDDVDLLNPAATGVVTLSDDSEVDGTNPITVTADPPATGIKITLHAIADGSGTGTFAWKITFPNDPPESATMTLTPLGSGTAVSSVDVLANSDDEDDTLVSGYYYVDFELVVGVAPDDTTYKFRHILHVYENMISAFEYEFADYSKPGIRGVIVDNWEFDIPDYAPELEDAADTGTALAGSPDVAISVDIGEIVTINVVNANDVDGDGLAYTTIEWFWNGTDVTAASDSDSLDIDTSGTPFDEEAGIYPLTVIGTINGVPYSTEILVELVEP